MRCPRCGFEGELIDGTCVHCGYQRVGVSENLRSTGTSVARLPSTSLRSQSGVLRSPSVPLRGFSGPLRSPSMPLRSFTGPLRSLSLYAAKSGDMLNQGRYRLVDQLILPDSQQGQGAAWLALDTMAGQTQVVIREVLVPADQQANKKQIVRQVALRLSSGSQQAGFPKVLDVFNELDSYFIVLQHIEGESLASLLRRQGGALPERTVAEYGRQLCGLLTVLAHQPVPLVHGAVSPETVIISPDRNRVHLIHLSLFPSEGRTSTGSSVGYKAPEQVQGVSDPMSDLYSVAATMHHAVTGFDPRERIAFFYPPVRRLNPVVSQHMETILIRELQLSAAQRYTHAADMQADLASLLARKTSETEKMSALTVVDPLKMDLLQMRERGRRSSLLQLSLLGVVCLLILGVGLFAYTNPSFRIPTRSTAPDPTATVVALQNALKNEWQAEAPLYQAKGLGLSDGRYVFDTSTGRLPAEVNDKRAAAQAVLENDIPDALRDYNQAVTSDKTDAEARIYYEDLQIEAQHDPYVTIILGLPLDGSPADLAITRPDLQAAFAFQDEINTQNPGPLPGGVKLRVLIANSGALDSDVSVIAQFIAQRVQIGNLDHVVAVVGWPTSAESGNALPILTAAQIPLITQTASGTSLGGISPDFFRVAPDDAAQGRAQAQLAYQVLGARRVLVLCDQNNPTSKSLADAFISSFTQLGGVVIDNPVGLSNSFTEGQTSVAQFRQQAVQNAVVNQVDLIFLPGSDIDAIRLAHALGLEENIYGWSAYLAGLKILGGNGVDTNLILGQGTGPDAALAEDYPQDMQRLIFTSFANPAEESNQLPAFLKNWERLYGVPSASDPDAPVPINTAMMVNDAFGVISYALGLITGPLTGESLRVALVSLGTGSVKPFQGLSGSIAFDNDGNPINKKLVLLQVVPDSATGQNTIQLVPGGNPSS